MVLSGDHIRDQNSWSQFEIKIYMVLTGDSKFQYLVEAKNFGLNLRPLTSVSSRDRKFRSQFETKVLGLKLRPKA